MFRMQWGFLLNWPSNPIYQAIHDFLHITPSPLGMPPFPKFYKIDLSKSPHKGQPLLLDPSTIALHMFTTTTLFQNSRYETNFLTRMFVPTARPPQLEIGWKELSPPLLYNVCLWFWWSQHFPPNSRVIKKQKLTSFWVISLWIWFQSPPHCHKTLESVTSFDLWWPPPLLLGPLHLHNFEIVPLPHFHSFGGSRFWFALK